MSFTDDQVQVVIALERVGASLSLFGITLILLTYSIFKRLRTIPNLFIVFASIANIGASIACVIGYDGIIQGEESALCQAQAFLLEMFMQSDPWWSMAMAINVFLVFFYGANPTSFKRYLWLYCLVCFGGPFIPAIALLLARPNGQLMYGNATLWCWINNDWNQLRIYTYYIPIWICILLSFVIYVAVGYHVFHQRNQLRNMTFSQTASGQDGKSVSRSENNDPDQAEKQYRPSGHDWQVTATTEVQITTAAPSESHYTPPRSPALPQDPATGSTPQRDGKHQRWAADEDDAPPSPSSVTHPRFETMISSDPRPPEPKTPISERMRFGRARLGSRLKGLDPVKLAYLRTSFIFAISILVTWTPSSINRVNDLVNPEHRSYGLNVATAVVLPLQGVWNAVIYFMTSWDTVKEEYQSAVARRAARRLDSRATSRLGGALRAPRPLGPRIEYDLAFFERNKRPNSDQTSEQELTGRTSSTHENTTPHRGSF
ncbi:G-protein coupled receptor [Plectosphaerella plurivora]|uniref:G-protein coupled receptor n=1 Tax=Plectosphaerella plurivora TaxID=936078 RepID=A0A9P8V4U9_9PEZI|nr:G-protein coupled receptor [Plectosphaerella plurivora]